MYDTLIFNFAHHSASHSISSSAIYVGISALILSVIAATAVKLVRVKINKK